MNQKIQQLMAQAGTDTSGKWMGVDNAERFAELIVQECATLIPAEQRHAPNGQPMVKIFKEYFEVEKVVQKS